MSLVGSDPRHLPPINTTNLETEHGRISIELTAPSASAQTPTQTLLNLATPLKRKNQDSLTVAIDTAGDRGRNELKKALALLLEQLQNRPQPPSIFESFKVRGEEESYNNLGVFAEAVKEAVKFTQTNINLKNTSAPTSAHEDDEDDGSHEFSTAPVIAPMGRLTELLSLSIKRGWDIFHDHPQLTDPGNRQSSRKSVSPFRRSRNSLQPSGRKSRSPSPSPDPELEPPSLLSQCISVLSSIISEDCRYQYTPPGPAHPPNTLQAMTINVAQLLVNMNRNKPKVLCQIGLAVAPAFGTFAPEMHSRLFRFFGDSVVKPMLDELLQVRGAHELITSISSDMTFVTESHAPLVSIQVHEAQEVTNSTSQNNLTWIPWTSITSQILKIQSSNAPLQQPSIYYLSSLIAPLLASVLDIAELIYKPGTTLDAVHRFYHFLHAILDLKLDSYLDILEVVAYHNPHARHAAVSLLMTLWPRAVGHPCISKPFAITSYLEATGMTDYQSDHPYTHYFVPWRFSSSHRAPSFGLSLNDCRSCSSPITGFGLLCSYCMCAVHFDCYDYPEGSQIAQYSFPSTDVQRMAMYRFSYASPVRRDINPISVTKQLHNFRLVNIFTLCMCLICREPLWGCHMQGFKCTSCPTFIHAACLSNLSDDNLPTCSASILDAAQMSISWSDLRRSCKAHYGGIITLTKEELAGYSYEELSVLFAVLWTQLQIVVHGVALGSIVVGQIGKNGDPEVDKFELHWVVQICEASLALQNRNWSSGLEDYLRENIYDPAEYAPFYDWSTLVYITSAIKSPRNFQSTSASQSSTLLNVLPPTLDEQSEESLSHPLEVVALSHMRDILGHDFGLRSDVAARYLLSHLHNLGFFNRLDSNVDLFATNSDPQHIYCVFPLPLGLDLSTDVESLVSAVEACLSDLDLSVNEFGFLLLVRKFWPNGMASEYAVWRLIRSILSWVLAEDDNLAMILRDYLAKQQNLPGVRSTSDPPPWPSVQSSRVIPTSSVNNGGDYVAARRTLLSRYVLRWLLALHNQDPSLYTSLLFDFAVEYASPTVQVVEMNIEKKARNADHFDKVIRCIARFSQTSVMFSVLDDVVIRWLESVVSSGAHEEAMPSIHRLLPREVDPSQRLSMLQDPVLPQDIPMLDPWRIIWTVARESKQGLSRSIRWLFLFAQSGVQIPMPTLMDFSALASRFEASFGDSSLLVQTVMTTAWLQPRNLQLQATIAAMHDRFTPYILDCLQTGSNLISIFRFVRQSLAACLLCYGCQAETIISLGLITEDEAQRFPSRRKYVYRGERDSDPVVMHRSIVQAVEQYINVEVDEVSCLIAKFLHVFLTESPHMKSYEIDNFILRNGKTLCICAWQFYEVQRPDIANIRTTFLLRTLVVDQEPFQSVLRDALQHNTPWESRLLAMTRLFRIILDVNSPSFCVEDRQWRSCIIDVFYYFFSSMWLDEKEEICLAVDAWSQTLLPAHFDAIMQCWSESLNRAPVADRVRLLSFLIQLRSHFPRWKVLTWDVIIETLLEDDYDQKNRDNEDGPASAHLSMYGLSSSSNAQQQSQQADSNMAMLRVSILTLSLQMVADGIPIDTSTLLRLKVHLAEVLGFSDVSMVPAPNGHAFCVRFGDIEEVTDSAYPCISKLLMVLDAPHPMALPVSAMMPTHDDNMVSPCLVGSIFADISIFMFYTIGDFLALPVLTFRNMIESLGIIIHKHDLECKSLRHLQQPLRRAMHRLLDVLVQDVSYEVRQLALTVTQTFIKRCNTFMGSFVFMSIETATKLIVSQSHFGQNDLLIAQARSFIETTLNTYPNGLFINICKRPLEKDFFLVLKQVTDANAKASVIRESLRVSLLRDTLPKAIDTEHNAFQTVMNNLLSFVDVVYFQGYNSELMQFVGQHLTQFARRASEWGGENVDPTPLLLIPSKLIQHNKMHSREMLSYTETVLRIILNRMKVATSSLSRLVHVTSTLYKKSQQGDLATPEQAPPNPIVQVVFEILGDGLRMKARVLPSTINSMLEVLMKPGIADANPLALTHLHSLFGLVDNGFHFLQNHVWSERNSQDDFDASLTVAKMVLEAAIHDANVMIRLSEHASEKSSRQLGVHVWNILGLASLMDPSENCISLLFAQLTSFAATHTNALRLHLLSGNYIPESATTDINHAYIGIKVWLMMAWKVSSQDIMPTTWFVVWNDLWTPFEDLISQLEAEVQNGHSSTLVTLTWSSVADLIMFLHALRCPLALEISTHLTILDRLRKLGGESSASKISRAMRSISESPPQTPFEVLVNQTGKDIIAAEKLRALELRRAYERKRMQERHKKDIRMLP